mgnify:CR=1 FL=1
MSRKIMFRLIHCMNVDLQVLAVSHVHVPFNLEKISKPEDGGGKDRSRRNADCIRGEKVRK